jgi:hypothetical protein
VRSAVAGGAPAARILPWLAAVLVAAVAWWASRPYAVGVFHDDGVYVILAKSIATGQGFRFLHLPGAPAATHYPPGYPLLLAAVWRVMPSFPENVSAFLFVNALLLGATALGVARFAERVLGWPRAGAVMAAIAATLSTPLLMLSGLVLSEPLFIAALFPAALLAERLVRDSTERGGNETRDALVLGFCLGLIGLVRTHGLALAVGVIIVLALRRRWRAMVLCGAAVAATLAPWQLWLAWHTQQFSETLSGSYGPYGSWLAQGVRGNPLGFLPRTMLINAREIGALFADHFSLSDHATPRLVSAVLATAAIVIGAWRLSKRAPVFVAFAVVYTLVLLAWPYTPWRFVFTVWPVVVLCVGATIDLALRAPRESRAGVTALRVTGALALLVVCAGAVWEEGRAYATRSWTRSAAQATAQIAPIVRWVNRETKVDDVVAVDGEQLVYLFTNRHAVPVVPFTAGEYLMPRTVADNAASLRRLIDEYPIKYVLTISPSIRASASLVASADGDGGGAATPSRRKPALVRIAPLLGGDAYRVDRPY